MVKRLLPWLLIGVAWSQTGAAEPVKSDPCRTAILQRVATSGLKSIHFYQLPAFYWQAWRCRRSGSPARLIAASEARQLDQDFATARKIEGCAYSCTYITLVVVTYFYTYQALRKS